MHHASLIKRYRDKAEVLRRQSDGMRTACARQTMQDAARDYEHMARGYEQLDEQRVDITRK